MIAFSNIDWFLNKLFKTKRRLLKATVLTLYKTRSYNGSKIEKELDFNYKNHEKTIERVSRNYLRDFN